MELICTACDLHPSTNVYGWTRLGPDLGVMLEVYVRVCRKCAGMGLRPSGTSVPSVKPRF